MGEAVYLDEKLASEHIIAKDSRRKRGAAGRNSVYATQASGPAGATRGHLGRAERLK
jgi:hypothetical protein